MPQNFSQSTNYNYLNITTATTTVVKAAPGILHKVVVNLAGAGAITIYDNASAASGTKIATLSTAAANATWIFDVKTTLGLTIVTAGTPDLTIVYS